jgi:phage tail sheath protein FI
VPAYTPPGVSLSFTHATAETEFRTGVPVFLGYAAAGRAGEATEVTRWSHFVAEYGPAGADPWPAGYLAAAVEGFFRNGGTLCRVVRMPFAPADSSEAEQAKAHADALGAALDVIDRVEDVDLVCVPDLFRPVSAAGAPAAAAMGGEEVVTLQTAVLDHCAARGDRFAILDAPPGADTPAVNAHAEALARSAAAVNGALYHPWLRLESAAAPCPPCGHVAGVYSATDAAVGFHKAPANVALDGVVDLEREVSETEHRAISAEVNCLRAFPGRGIRVWGARTLGGRGSPAWTYVPVRRVFLTIARWIEQFMMRVSFEVNGQTLWSRITREVSAYLADLHRRGILLGATPQDAFYVRCDSATNPSEMMDMGQVVTEVGIAAGAPNEFIAVRVTHVAGGVTITGLNPA